MKRTFLFRMGAMAAIAGCLAGGVTAQAADSEKSYKEGTLQVQVNIPPTWRPFLEDRVSEEFVARIRNVFRQEGFNGDVVEVRSFDEPSPGCCLVMINLTEWRINHIGNIDCTFTANLQTGNASRHLGVFTNTAFGWIGGSGRFGLRRSFDEAAEGAIRELYRAIAETDLVPGIRTA